MRICLILSSNYITAGRPAKGKKAWIHGLSLPLLAAYIGREHSLTLINDFVHPLPDRNRFDVFFIFVMGGVLERTRDLARTLKTKNNFIIICGKTLNETAARSLPSADSIVLGEAETLIEQIISDVKNKCLKKQYGKPSLRSSLENLPVPRYDLIDRKRHGFIYPVEATRGCVNSCSYCYVQSWTKGVFRKRPVEQVIRDIRYLKRMNIRHIFFVDDNIFADRDFAISLFKRMIPLKIKWISQAAGGAIADEELMKTAAASGLMAAAIGLESMTAKTLAKVNNPNNPETYEKGIALLNRLNILNFPMFAADIDKNADEEFEKIYRFCMNSRATAPLLHVLNTAADSEMLYEDAYRKFYKSLYSSKNIFTRVLLKRGNIFRKLTALKINFFIKNNINNKQPLHLKGRFLHRSGQIVNPKVFLSIFEYACERRELDAKRVLDFFEKNNYFIVHKPEQADIIIYITCGIIEKNTEASISTIRKFQKYGARLIVGGCAADIEPERVQAVHWGEYFSTRNLNVLDHHFPNEEYHFRNIGDANCRYTALQKNIWNGTVFRVIDAIPGVGKFFRAVVNARIAAVFGEYSLAYIKAVGLEKDYHIRIADGCPSNCTYCSHRAAIGQLKSKSASQCVKEFKRGLEKGFKNITITAEDTGVWGDDFAAAKGAKESTSTANIASLLRQMISSGGSSEYSLIINSLNPASLYRNLLFLEDIFHNPVIRRVVVPVQSLVSRLLKLMNRFYGIPAIRQSLSVIRRASPNIWISTHILIGFPSETTEEFYETLSLWEELPFDEGQFFAFSLKKGTPAEKIKGRLSEKEIRRRMKLAHKYFKKRGYACFFHDYEFLFVSKKTKMQAR